MKKRGLDAWYGFDLDGTLAYHSPGGTVASVGEPIEAMIKIVKGLLAEGKECRIVTARVSPEWGDREEQTGMIQDWCEKHIGERLQVQAHKNGGMICLYDDRAIGIQRNTGIPLHQLHLAIDRMVAAARVERAFFDSTGIQMDPRTAEAIAKAVLKEYES